MSMEKSDWSDIYKKKQVIRNGGEKRVEGSSIRGRRNKKETSWYEKRSEVEKEEELSKKKYIS